MSKERMYGYVRVSAQEQNEERQLIAMREFGVEEEYIVIEKQSGKDFKRPRYRAMLRQMHAGDVLVIKSIDRLGRNYTEILEQPLWCWTCPFWTRGRGGTSPGP